MKECTVFVCTDYAKPIINHCHAVIALRIHVLMFHVVWQEPFIQYRKGMLSSIFRCSMRIIIVIHKITETCTYACRVLAQEPLPYVIIAVWKLNERVTMSTVEFRAVVNLDLKGFSLKTSALDDILSSEAILQLQDSIKAYIETAIAASAPSEAPLRGFSGGDNAYVFFRVADDAFRFVEVLHGMSKQARCEDNMHRRMLFHSGAHYGEIAYHEPHDPNDLVIDLGRAGGKGMTIASRPSGASKAGQFIVTKSFFEKLSPQYQERFGKAFTLREKSTVIPEVRSIRFLTHREASEIGDVGFPVNDVLYPPEAWPILWPLLMTGTSFYTINHLTPDKWENNDIAKFGVAILRNMVRSFSANGESAAKRLFMLADEEDVAKYRSIFDLHVDVPIRTIRQSKFEAVMAASLERSGHVDIQILPFSISSPLFQTDFHNNCIIASFAYLPDDEAGYSGARKLAGIHITGADHSTQMAYVAAFAALWEMSDPV